MALLQFNDLYDHANYKQQSHNGKYTSGFWSNLMGGITFVVMLFAAVFTLTHLI